MKALFSFNLVLALVFTIVGCNSTQQMQKAFNNNQGILSIPVEYTAAEVNDAAFSNARVVFEITEVDSEKTASNLFKKEFHITISEGMSHALISGLAPGEYKVTHYSLTSNPNAGWQADWANNGGRSANIFFKIVEKEISILNKQFFYRETSDSSGMMITSNIGFTYLPREQKKQLEVEMQQKKQKMLVSN